MQHVHEASGRHAQPEALPQERGHLRERHADFFVQARHQRDGARPQVDVGGPDRVRGLQGMSTLHAASTLGALPDGHIKAPHDRLDGGRSSGSATGPVPRHTPDTPREAGPRRSHRRGRESGAVPGAHTGGRPVAPVAHRGPGADPWRTARPAGTRPVARPRAAAAAACAAASTDRAHVATDHTHLATDRAHLATDHAHAAPDPVPGPCAPRPPAAARPLRRGGAAVRPSRRRWDARVHRPREIYGRLAPKVQVQNCNLDRFTR